MKSREKKMEHVTDKKLKGSHLMPCGKGTVSTGAKGFVFLPSSATDHYESE